MAPELSGRHPEFSGLGRGLHNFRKVSEFQGLRDFAYLKGRPGASRQVFQARGPLNRLLGPASKEAEIVYKGCDVSLQCLTTLVMGPKPYTLNPKPQLRQAGGPQNPARRDQ